MEKKFIGNIVGVDGGTKKQRSDVYEMSFWFIDNYLARHRSLDIDIWLRPAKGLLKDLNKKGTKVWWRGFQYENFDYYKQPWERQAYRKQETINKAWKQYVKTRKKKILTIDVK